MAWTTYARSCVADNTMHALTQGSVVSWNTGIGWPSHVPFIDCMWYHELKCRISVFLACSLRVLKCAVLARDTWWGEGTKLGPGSWAPTNGNLVSVQLRQVLHVGENQYLAPTAYHLREPKHAGSRQGTSSGWVEYRTCYITDDLGRICKAQVFCHHWDGFSDILFRITQSNCKPQRTNRNYQRHQGLFSVPTFLSLETSLAHP